MSTAYACEIKETNFNAIRSEYPNFNLEETRAWIAQNGRGWFIRDEGTMRDCMYITHAEIGKVYLFLDFDPHTLFRPLTRL